MKSRSLILKTLLILFLSVALVAQNAEIENELSRLKTAIEQVEAVVQLLSNNGSSDVTMTVLQKFQEAKSKFQEALTLARNGQNRRAGLVIKQAFTLLKQIEAIIKQSLFLRTNFQEQLDRRIQQAEQVVRNIQDQRLISLLERAKNLRQQAYQLFNRGNIREAFEHYHSALEYANQIIQVANNQSDIRGDDEWRKFYLDTQLLWERAQMLANNSDNTNQWRNLINRAEIELEDVKRLYDKKNYAAAHQKLVTINRLLFRIIDNVEKNPRNDLERIRVELESLEISLQTIKDKMAGQTLPAAQRIYRRVDNLIKKIGRLINNQNYQLARRNLTLASQLLLKLNRLIENSFSNEPQNIENQISRAKSELDKMRLGIDQQDEPTKFIKLIENNLESAEKALNEGEYLKASYHLKITNRMILRYNRAQLKAARENIQESILQRDRQYLITLLQQFDSEKNDEHQIRYQNARELQRLADQAFQNGNLALSVELTKMAINLITQ